LVLMVGEILQNQPARPEIYISNRLIEDLIRICVEALPHKAYGMVGGEDVYHPKSLYPCSTNLRNTPEWKPFFESYGDFYKNPDLGFVIAPQEVQSVLDVMESRRESFVGVFHSHRYLRAVPSEIDIALSPEPNYLCYIVSTVNPAAPEFGIFRLEAGGFVKLPVKEMRL
jgi:proteasome lid subunit RPN8/RPN11